jgi:hypothetical protein
MVPLKTYRKLLFYLLVSAACVSSAFLVVTLIQQSRFHRRIIGYISTMIADEGSSEDSDAMYVRVPTSNWTKPASPELPEVTFYRVPPSNLTTIKELKGDWRTVHRHTVTANATPSDASFMPILVNGTTGEVSGFAYSAFTENRDGPPRVRVLAVVGDPKHDYFCLLHWSRVNWDELPKIDPRMLVRAITSAPIWPDVPHFVFILCPLPDNKNTSSNSEARQWPSSVSLYHSQAAAKGSYPGNNVLVIQGFNANATRPTDLSIKRNMARCTKPMKQSYKHGALKQGTPYGDVVQFIEHIEFFAAMGVTYFPIYGISYTKEVRETNSDRFLLASEWVHFLCNNVPSHAQTKNIFFSTGKARLCPLFIWASCL